MNMRLSIDSLSLSILSLYTVLIFVIYESLFLVCQEIWLQNGRMELDQSGSRRPVIILSGNPFLKCIPLKTDYDSCFPFSHHKRVFQKLNALKLRNFLLNSTPNWLINHFQLICLTLEQLKMLLPSPSWWLTFLCTCREKSYLAFCSPNNPDFYNFPSCKK